MRSGLGFVACYVREAGIRPDVGRGIFRRGTLRRMGSVFPGLPRRLYGNDLIGMSIGVAVGCGRRPRWGGMEAAYLFINDSFPDLRKTGDRCAGSLIWSLWALLRRNGRSCRDYRNSSAGCFSQDWRAVGEGSFLHDTIRKPRFLFTLDPVGVGRNELCPALAARAASPEGLLARRRIDPADDRALEMVAYGDGQPVRRVEMRRRSVIWSMLLSREATCSFEADPRPVIACLEPGGARIPRRAAPGSARRP